MATRSSDVTRLYVSAPSDLDLRPLLDGLKRRGAEPYVLSDVAPLGADIAEGLRLAIDQADRVLVVLTAEPALNPVLEAGVALALQKPLLIIATPGASVPSDLKGQLIVQARPDDLDAVNFALDHAKPTAMRPDHELVAKPTGQPLGADMAERLLTRLANDGLTERSAVEVILEAVEASRGIGAVNADPGFDLGVWSDDLDAIGGNPLLVEVKRSLRPGAVDQVLLALDSHPSAQIALLIYIEPSTEPLSQAELEKARFPVLVISIQQLLQRMALVSFAEVVRDLRNRSAHGLGPL